MDLNTRFAYSRWDGTQRVFELDEGAVMDEMADSLIAHGDVHRALRDLFQRGFRSADGERMAGLRDLQERLRQQRQQQLERYNMDSVIKDLEERLDQVIKIEREGIDRRLQEAREELAQSSEQEQSDRHRLMDLLQQRADRNRERLDELPESLGGTVRALQQYDFIDPEAQHQFQELMDMLRRQMTQNVAEQMRDQIKQTRPEEMATLREMMRDLTRMMREKLTGLEPDFEGFMQRWGAMFGDKPPQSFDELLEMLQRQTGQTQSLLDSMSPEQRQALFEAMNAVMDDETAREVAELGMNMSQLYPANDFRQHYPFLGEESLTLDQAMGLMGELQSMDNLEQELESVMRQGNVRDLDLAEMERLMGQEARQEVERLQRLVRDLEEAGYLQWKGDKLKLTPQGIRKIAMKALREIFAQLRKGETGHHELHARGSGGERADDTKPYEFGDPFELDLQKTVINAVLRNGAGTPVHLATDDFEVHRTEHLTRAATVLLLDQSRSMGLFGSFVAAKKVALALYALVKSRFPRDQFFIIGFSDYAIPLKGEDLPEMSWNAWVSGTNMQHAFMLSRKLLSRYKGATKQIIMITDGEPTAYLEGDRPYFSYPPSYRTVQETLKEARRCTQDDIVINTFMLETSHYLLDFVDRLTRANRGRALYTTPGKLGEYVLVDYLSNRKRRVVS